MRVVAIRSRDDRPEPHVQEAGVLERVAAWLRTRRDGPQAGDARRTPREGAAAPWDDQLTEEFSWLAECYALSSSELGALLVGAAIERYPDVSDVLAQANGQPHLRYLSWRALRALLGDEQLGVGKVGPLHRLRLVQEEELGAAEPALVRLEPFIASYLLGRPGCDPRIADRLEAVPDVTPLAAWCVDERARRLHARLASGPARLWVSGAEGSGRRSLCQALARALGSEAFFVETRGLGEEEFHELRLRATRQVVLLGHILIWSSDIVRRPPRALPARPAVEFIVATPEDAADRGGPDDVAEVAAPTSDERRELWTRLVPQTQLWPEAERARLDGYRVQVGDIAAVAQSGASTFEEVAQLCRRSSRGRIEEFAEVLDCPFRRDDLVLAKSTREALDDFIHEAHVRSRFWERAGIRRLFPRGRGLVGLLAGSPGTGKTMAAQVVAAELRLDLVRVDLALVVSKYIGETSKNLARVFRAARQMNAVLFFDEADALFSKRTEVKDAHDRYANADTNYLLQHLEDFDGVALLATNKKGNIDAAFLRRLRFVLEFARPTAEQRLEIYRTLLDQMAGNVAPELRTHGLRALADSFDVSGAQIKLAILAAIFRAEREGVPLTMGHILLGIERELGKEGRAPSRADRERALARLGGAS